MTKELDLDGFEFRSSFRDITQGMVLKPLLHNYLYDASFPEFSVHFEKQDMERKPDGWFHPSTHPLMTEGALYRYLAQPKDFPVEKKQYMSTLSVTVGKVMHDFVEMCLTDLGVRPPEMQICSVCPPKLECKEAGLRDEEVGERGHVDGFLDLSHLGYVHTKTIGGNAKIHVQADMTVETGPDTVRVVRHMRDSQPPPTYLEAWPFPGKIDRWQEIEFRVTHFLIWTGGMDAGSGDLKDPNREGFHMRGFHGITPETETTSFYFWTISSNKNPERPNMVDTIHKATAFTFDEDRLIIEAQHANITRFGEAPMVGIHVDAAPNRARMIVSKLSSS